MEHNDFLYEDHFVITEDGYILNLFRIKHRETEYGAPAVLLQHGIVDTADAWLVHDADKALAFRLASEGYDVFLGNNRGTRYSLNHVKLKYESWDDRREYNDFSWRE